MTTLQTNLALAHQHLRQLNHELNHVKKCDLFDIIPRIYEKKKGSYLARGRKLIYLSKQEKEIMLNRIERTLDYQEKVAKKKELERWINRIENEIARLSCENFPRVAI